MLRLKLCVITTMPSPKDRVVKVVKTTCFLADINDFSAFNEVYGKYFTTKPARSCVAVKDLPKGVKVEVEVIATL